ncbi:zinc finger, CCHC-type containing protein [Tanacetum coccineum]
MRLFGYVEYSKAFRFYVIKPNESVLINSIIRSRDAIFDENRFSSVLRASQRSLINGTEDIGGLVVPKEVVTQQPKPDLRKGKRNRTSKNFGPEFQLYLIEGTRDEIFKRKLKVDGTIEKFKARLVIQVFRQKSRIDYFDTYALVARIGTIRLLIAMTSIHNLIIHQMDVKTTFSNGELDEKQALKQWHQKFDEIVLSNGYLLNQADKCTKELLSSRFSMKDTREADVIFGIRIKHESNGIAISQSHYIEKVLKKFNYFDCTPVSTLMDTSEKMMLNNGQAVSQLEYSSVISCLMYAMTCTRPNIAFIVGNLSSYPLVLEGYTYASWISNIEDNLSTNGWGFLLGGEAAGKEAELLRNLILEILLWSKPITPISIHCDSAATLAKAYSQMYNGKSRHLGVRHNMIPELITNGVVSIEFVRSQ